MLIAALLLVLVTPIALRVPVAAELPAPLPHVRAADAAARALVADGSRRSPLLRSLLAALDTHRVVVFVRMPASCPSRGVLRFVSRAAGITYLAACVDARQSDVRRLAALAHELRHVLEVAEARPPVAGTADLERLYKDIGMRIGPGIYETQAAAAVERQVLKEALAWRRGGAHRMHELISWQQDPS